MDSSTIYEPIVHHRIELTVQKLSLECTMSFRVSVQNWHLLPAPSNTRGCQYLLYSDFSRSAKIFSPFALADSKSPTM